MRPVKIVVNGDQGMGRILVGFAKNELFKLERRMANTKPKPLNEGYHTIEVLPGVTIEALSSYKHREVRVHVAPDAPLLKGRPQPPIETERKCPCYPHFAIGRIIAVYPDPLIVGEANYIEFLLTGLFTYDIEVCAADSYVQFLGAEDMNYGRYYAGQVIMATLAEDMDAWVHPYDCDRSCLLSSPRFDLLAVSPIYNADGMFQWLPEVEVD